MSDAERSGSGVEATSAKTARKLPASISGNPIPSNGTLAGRCIATGSPTKNLPRADYVPNLKCANCGFVQPSYKIISTKASLPHFRRPWVERDRLHVELVSKDQNLGFQRSPRPNQSDQRHTRSTCKHRSSGASISRFGVAVSRFGFAVGTGGGPAPCCPPGSTCSCGGTCVTDPGGGQRCVGGRCLRPGESCY